MSPTDTAAALTAEEVAARLKAATAKAFAAESAGRQRDPHRLGLSHLGGCTRKAVYALSRTPVTDTPPPREGRAANLGTWEHEGLLPRLAQQLPGARVERKVTLRVAGLEIRGSIDLDSLQSLLTVVDLKTVGEHKLHNIRRTSTPFRHNLIQLVAYALALLQEGNPPRYIAFLYMDRASGDEEVIVLPFTNELALMVIDRVTELRRWAEEDPDAAPREERGPGLSFACDECHWLKRCWGDEAVPGRTGPQSVRTDPEVIEALADYDDARARANKAEKDKEWAVARLEKVRYGTYGPWRYGRDRDGESVDLKRAVERLKALGQPVPMKGKRGSIRIKLIKAAPVKRTTRVRKPADGGQEA